MNGRDSLARARYTGGVKPLFALLAFFLLAAAAPAVETGPVRLCPTALPGADCAPVDLTGVRLSGPGTTLVRTVHVDREALPLSRPLMVWVIALASSEVSWNGVPIGRNGVPAADRAGERPGRFVANFVVPDRLVRPGENRLSARLSAHHLWLPVRTPVHQFDVGPYQTPNLPGLSHYLPALLMLGALAAAFVYFAAAALGDRRERGARLLAAIAGLATLQLGAEVSRAFIAYTYPWHLARVSLIALLAAATAIAIAAYGAHRFAPRRRRMVIAATAAAAAASLLLLPWFDMKALGAILAAGLALAAASGIGLRDGRPLAATGLAAAVGLIGLMAWQRTLFLDQGYYVFLAALLVALIAEQLSSLRRARAERDRETRRAAALAQRLAQAEREGEAILALKDGSRTHRVVAGDIVAIRAADDYCDVILADGRTLLVTMSLARLLDTLPGPFVRVHKSHAVNRAHVTALAPRPGGGRDLALSDGSRIPVGRSYRDAVAAWSSA